MGHVTSVETQTTYCHRFPEPLTQLKLPSQGNPGSKTQHCCCKLRMLIEQAAGQDMHEQLWEGVTYC